MNFKPTFCAGAEFKPTFAQSNAGFEADFGKLQIVTELVGGELYQGDYEVTPQVNAQTLPTKTMVMKDDVTIHEIPYAEVTNTSGGLTATIG